MAPSERKRVGENSGAGLATGQDANELDGIDLDAFAVDPLAVLPAGGALEHKFERFPMNRPPFGDDVSYEPAVVLGGQMHVAADRVTNIDPVGPHIAGKADVEEVLQRRPTDGRPDGNLHVAGGQRCAPPPFDGSGSNDKELRHQLGVGQIRAFTDLHFVESVDPFVRIDLLVHGYPAPELMKEFSD